MIVHHHTFTTALSILLFLNTLYSTRLFAQDESSVLTPDSTTTVEEALRHGDYTFVAQYLGSLDKKELKKRENKLLEAKLRLAYLDYEGASELLDELHRKSRDKASIDPNLDARVARTERMLQSAIMMYLLEEPQLFSKEDAYSKISSLAHPIGEVTERYFTPKSGQVRWQVIDNGQGGETFGIVYRLGDGTWDESHIEKVELLGLSPTGKVAFPFLLSDGETLYFAYLGPETLGGYDLYVSRYNPTDHTLLVPQQLPIPVNSPADDIAYIYDEETEGAAFLTGRGAEMGSYRLVTYKMGKDLPPFPTEKDSISEVLSLKSLPRSLDEVKLFAHDTPQSDLQKKAVLWIQDRAIYGEDELSRPTSIPVFRRYLKLQKEYDDTEMRLLTLRQEVSEKGSASASLGSEIVALERELRERSRELIAVRNEVIKSETTVH